MWALWLIVFPGLCWVLPGVLVSRRLFVDTSPLERVGSALVLGCATVGPLAFVLSFVLRSPLTPTTVLVSAAAVSMLALAVGRPRSSSRPVRSSEGWPLILILVAVAAITAMTTAPKAVETTQIWAPCIHESAFLMLEDGSGGGLEVYAPTLDRTVVHRTMRPIEPAWGLGSILGHQRPGSMVTIGQTVAFFGSGGPVVMTFIDDLMVLFGAALIIGFFVPSAIISAVGSTLFLLGSRHVALYMVNENVLALGLALGAISMLLRGRSVAAAAGVGVVLALGAGVRPIMLSALPAAWLAVQGGMRARAAVAGGLGVGLAPWLWTNFQTYGSPLYHPSLDVPQLQQTFLGFEFAFHPLNWPVADQLMRPATSPLPNLLSMPLEHTAAFGALFCIVCVLGLCTIGWRKAFVWLLWGLPVYALLAMIVALDYEKQSYALMAFAPLPVFFGAGARALFSSSAVTLTQRIAAMALAIALLVGLRAVVPTMDIPVDTREQYVRPTISAGSDRYQTAKDPELAWQNLLDIGLLPKLSNESGLAWTLLSHAGPPHRSVGEAAQDTVIVWQDGPGLDVVTRVRASADTPNLPLIEQLGSDCGSRHAFMMMDIAVAGAADAEVDVRVRQMSKRVLRVDVTSPETAARGTGRITVGYHDTAVEVLRDVQLFIDGVEVSPTAVLLESHNPGSEPNRSIRLVTNVPWHLQLDADKVRYLPGPGSPLTCQTVRTNQGALHLSPTAIRVEKSTRCTVRMVGDLPARPLTWPCPTSPR
ncbi:MAG: hypothetical protein ACI9OJ_003315 [Myxococcota bacterium]